MINKLKRQVINFKQIVKSKEDEISNLKNNSKIAKLQSLETEYLKKNEENYFLKENLENLKQAFYE